MRDISKLSSKELAELARQKREEERQALLVRRQAYEGIRAEIVQKIALMVWAVIAEVW